MYKVMPVILIAVFLVSFNACAQFAGYRDFEIVETPPVETNLDNADIRNAHEVWLEMINGAKKSLDLEEFYISDQKGELLQDVLAAIVEAGKRGVAVRIIADGNMHKTYPQPVDSLGLNKNVSVRIIDFKKLKDGVQHAKYFIVDGEQIYLGSQNFDWRSLKHIHELGVRIRNTEAVNIYRDIFDIDWQLAEKNDPALVPSVVSHKQYELPISIIETPGDTLTYFPTMSPKGMIVDSTLWDETNIVNLIDGAKSDVMVQVLTYSPEIRNGGFYPALDSAFRRAAARGVQVKLIVSDWSIGEHIIPHLKNLARIPNIQVKFTSIPEYSGGYVSFARVEHCKYLVVDSAKCWIGTSNWEKGYFYNLRNLGVIVQNQKINGIMKRIFFKSWDGPYSTLIKSDGVYEARKHGEK
jgi:phosphatidylserine/phosphatidylglycerophosphate/cardiolipin synthase-like enzyme